MHQLIIIGAGPAGLTAGLFAQRYNLDFTIIATHLGGTAMEAHWVDNYPGIEKTSGAELVMKFQNQIKPEYIVQQEVKSVEKSNHFKVVTQQNEYESTSLILAVGTQIRKLDIKGEAEYLGRGVSYCVACDGPLAQDKEVVVVGGGDSALTSALKLADICRKVYLIHRRDEFRAAPVWIEKVKESPKIEIVYSAKVEKIEGSQLMEKVILDNDQEIKAEWLFIEIGSHPFLDLYQKLNLETDEGYILTDKNQATNVPGVFAAGDVVADSFRQIITACGQGAVAANAAYGHIKANEQRN